MLTIDRMSISPEKVSFDVGGIVKHSKQGKTNPPCVIYKFEEDHRVCPKGCLEAYLEVTKSLRGSEGGPLFISFAKPHKVVGKDTIRRWILLGMKECGIDSSQFKAHSIRGASGSKARASGAPLEHILALGNWSNKTTFEKFYFRKTPTSPTQEVQKRILTILN